MARKYLVVAVLALFSLFLAGELTADSAVIYVKSGGSDQYSGASWSQAKQTVQGAISSASSGDEIWVAAGRYQGCISVASMVGIYGGFAGTESQRSQRNSASNVTTLDGGQAGSVVTFSSNVTTSTILDGFIVTNGDGTTSNGFVYGGGVYCDHASPTIRNCVITGNSAQNNGGGIYCRFSSPYIRDNTVSNNIAGNGSGIYCSHSSPCIYNNTISGNTSQSAGHMGGGISCGDTDSSPSILTNRIYNNSADFGGGIFYAVPSMVCIANNLLYGNASVKGSAIYANTITPPGIQINGPTPTSTTSGPVNYTIAYTGVDGISLSTANITLNSTGGATGSLSVSGAGNTSRTVTLSGISGSGTLGISVAAGTASDAEGNLAPAAGPSSTVSVASSAQLGTPIIDPTGTVSLSWSCGSSVDHTSILYSSDGVSWSVHNILPGAANCSDYRAWNMSQGYCFKIIAYPTSASTGGVESSVVQANNTVTSLSSWFTEYLAQSCFGGSYAPTY